MDYKNEVYIEQGTVANGYVSSSIYNTIQRVLHANDVCLMTSATTPFTSKYGGWHSTYLYAYYHQGNNEGTTTQGTACQDWATFTVTTLATRPTLSGQAMNSTQPGPKLQNTFGVLLEGTAGVYITFSTNTWTSSGYAFSGATNYGWGMFGQNYGYTWNYGFSDTYYINWSTATWAGTGGGSPPGSSQSSLGKALNTKWGKFYHTGDQSANSNSLLMPHFNTASSTWTAAVSSGPNYQVEQSCMMGQDWGYLLGGYGPSGNWAGQNAYSCKMNYANDTVYYSAISNGNNALSSANACWGPLP
jgi:hypothetical protein